MTEDHAKVAGLRDERLTDDALHYRSAKAIDTPFKAGTRWPVAEDVARRTLMEMKRRKSAHISAWEQVAAAVERRDRAALKALVGPIVAAFKAAYDAANANWPPYERPSRAKPKEEQGHRPGDPNCDCKARCRNLRKTSSTSVLVGAAEHEATATPETAALPAVVPTPPDAPVVYCLTSSKTMDPNEYRVVRSDGRHLMILECSATQRRIKVHKSRLYRDRKGKIPFGD